MCWIFSQTKIKNLFYDVPVSKKNIICHMSPPDCPSPPAPKMSTLPKLTPDVFPSRLLNKTEFGTFYVEKQ